MCESLLPTTTATSSIISFCHTSPPYLTNVVLPGPVESSYDDHMNLIDLHSSSKAPATLLLPPARPFHRSGNPSTSRQPLLGHLSLPISPTATGPATSLRLIRRHLVSNSSHSTDYGSRDEPDPSQLLLPGRSVPLHLPATAWTVVSTLLGRGNQASYIFPSHQRPSEQPPLPFSLAAARQTTSCLLTTYHSADDLFPSHLLLLI